MFYFSIDNDTKLEVIDGQQRLTTMFGYIDLQSIKRQCNKKKGCLRKLK